MRKKRMLKPHRLYNGTVEKLDPEWFSIITMPLSFRRLVGERNRRRAEQIAVSQADEDRELSEDIEP